MADTCEKKEDNKECSAGEGGERVPSFPLSERARMKAATHEDHEGAQQCLTKRSSNVGQKARASLMDVTLIDRKPAV